MPNFTSFYVLCFTSQTEMADMCCITKSYTVLYCLIQLTLLSQNDVYEMSTLAAENNYKFYGLNTKRTDLF